MRRWGEWSLTASLINCKSHSFSPLPCKPNVPTWSFHSNFHSAFPTLSPKNLHIHFYKITSTSSTHQPGQWLPHLLTHSNHAHPLRCSSNHPFDKEALAKVSLPCPACYDLDIKWLQKLMCWSLVPSWCS
jgi:hypothetical protein